MGTRGSVLVDGKRPIGRRVVSLPLVFHALSTGDVGCLALHQGCISDFHGGVVNLRMCHLARHPF